MRGNIVPSRIFASIRFPLICFYFLGQNFFVYEQIYMFFSVIKRKSYFKFICIGSVNFFIFILFTCNNKACFISNIRAFLRPNNSSKQVALR